MLAKARENLAAAEALIAANCPNAAIGRAYYAAYQAIWHELEEMGYEPPLHNGRRYWRHDTFPDDILKMGTVDEAEAELVRELRDYRVLADYRPDDLSLELARVLFAEVRELVKRLCEGK
jgi:uncharacterized protein (UPF0332 family)